MAKKKAAKKKAAPKKAAKKKAAKKASSKSAKKSPKKTTAKNPAARGPKPGPPAVFNVKVGATPAGSYSFWPGTSLAHATKQLRKSLGSNITVTKKNPKKAAPKKAAKKAAPKKAAKKASSRPRPRAPFADQVASNPGPIKRGESLAKRGLRAQKARVRQLDLVNLTDGQRSRVKLVAVTYSQAGTRYVHRPKDGGAYLYGAQPSACKAEKSPRVERIPVGSVEWGRVESLVLDCGGQEVTLAFPGGHRPYLMVAPNARSYEVIHTTATWEGCPSALRVMLTRKSSKKVASARGLID